MIMEQADRRGAGSGTAPEGPPRRATEWVVDAEHAGQRIDNFLMARLKSVPRSHVYRILRKGEVRVNKGRIRQGYRLQAGDVVRIPPVRTGAPAAGPAPVPRGLQDDLARRILHEDAGLLVLDKPAGLAVHGGSGVSLGAIEALRALRGAAAPLELVHRLDRDTSGCLLIAKRRSALRRLHELLRSGRVEKRYLALLAGPWQGGERVVNLPLRKNTLRSGARVVRVDREGKDAVSVFRPLASASRACLAEITLVTGRTHQIRVHAAALEQPLGGDEKYGDEAFNRMLRERGLRRLFLHAHALRIPGEGDGGGALEVAAPLPAELRAVLAQLGLDDGLAGLEADASQGSVPP
mgnify:CR=1 FL=1